MTGFEYSGGDLADDIGTIADWLVILLVYFTVMACLIVPIAMAANARPLDEHAGLPAATDVTCSAIATSGTNASA